MPTYGYKCSKCTHTYEVFQRITDKALTQCEKCGGEINRVLYPVGIVFKGSGFHVNDYRKSEPSTPEAKPEAPAKETVAATEST